MSRFGTYAVFAALTVWLLASVSLAAFHTNLWIALFGAISAIVNLFLIGEVYRQELR